MRTQMILLAVITQVFAEELVKDFADKRQDSMDDLLDQMAHNLVIELSNRMSAVMQSQSPAYHTELDNTVLGKPGQLPVRASFASPLYALPTSSARSPAVRAPRPNIIQPEKGRGSLEDVVPERQEVAQSLTKPDTWKAMEPLAVSEEVPYALNFFVHGGEFGDLGTVGETNEEYMQTRIRSALKNSEDKIQSVDVRLNVEGSMTAHRTYRLEVTVKMRKDGTLVLSNPKNAEHTFIEAVDHMHDTLKRAVQKDSKKKITKIRHARRNAEGAELPATPEEVMGSKGEDESERIGEEWEEREFAQTAGPN